MKTNVIFFFALLLLAACAAPQPTPAPYKPPPTEIPLAILSTPEIYIFPTSTPTGIPILFEDFEFLTAFSKEKQDWKIIPANITPAQLHAAVRKLEGDELNRREQKVINGFITANIEHENGQMFSVLLPAEIVNNRLQAIKVEFSGQVPILASHATLAENFFQMNYPREYQKWISQGASEADFQYAAIVVVTWATKYGPLRVSYMMSGKYIQEAEKYPGRADYLRACMFDQTKTRSRPGMSLYPAPIVGVSVTMRDGAFGEIKNDGFGWTPMADFAKSQAAVLEEIGKSVNGVRIESKETLAELQAAFDRAFMPVHCAITTFQ